jgi:hypothetical protein
MLLLTPTVVRALGSDHPNAAVNNDKWPAGLAELVNAKNRVHGYFVNWEDVFFFRGDTAALNTFLSKCAELANTKVEVVLHPGKLEVRSPWNKEPLKIAGNWQLYASPFSREQVEGDHVKPGRFIVRVDVWLGETLKLSELVVPANVAVRSGGEIDAFVKTHNDAKAIAP